MAKEPNGQKTKKQTLKLMTDRTGAQHPDHSCTISVDCHCNFNYSQTFVQCLTLISSPMKSTHQFSLDPGSKNKRKTKHKTKRLMYQKWEGTILKFLACYKRTNSKSADILFLQKHKQSFVMLYCSCQKNKILYLFLRYNLCSFFARKLF